MEKKHGAEYRRQWRKLHIGIDAQTLEIRAIEVTPNSVGDAPVLPSLLRQIDLHEALLSVSGDETYDTKACHEAIALRQAQAIIRCERMPGNLGGETAWSQRPQRDLARDTTTGSFDLEALERVSPAQPGRDQDAVREAHGRANHGAELRASRWRSCRCVPPS